VHLRACKIEDGKPPCNFLYRILVDLSPLVVG